MKNTARKPENSPTSAERHPLVSAQRINAADALMAVFGFRRVQRPTSEQMLKALADAADEQRRVLVGASTAATQKTRVVALKRASVVLAGRDNKEQMQ